MINNTSRIGLVLASLPSYSESFINTKISGLVEQGFEVSLFVPKTKNKRYLGAKIYHPWPLDWRVLNVKVIIQVLTLFTVKFKVLKLFLELEKINQRNPLQRWKNLYINGHILIQHMDWLHFGFGSFVMNRENVASAIGAKMGVSIRGFDMWISPLKHPGMYNLLWAKRFKLHYLSDSLLKRAIELGYKDNCCKMKITPAIDTTKFSSEYKEKDRSNRLKIITVARLHWVKGLEIAINALGEVKKQGLDFEYLIFGEGKEYERLCYASLQNDLANEINFRGREEQDKIIQELETSSIFLMPSISEGFCNAVLEAQAMGLICIVSDAGGLPENVINNETGFVYPKYSSAALAELILRVHSYSRDQRKKIETNAMNRIKEEFSLKEQKKKWVEFYSN